MSLWQSYDTDSTIRFNKVQSTAVLNYNLTEPHGIVEDVCYMTSVHMKKQPKGLRTGMVTKKMGKSSSHEK